MKDQYIISHKIWLWVAVLFAMLSVSSCKNFVEVDAPITSVNGGNVYTENSNAIAVLTGLYAKMASSSFSLNLSVFPDLSADNLTLFDQNATTSKLFYQNALMSDYQGASSVFWFDLYSDVYVANAAIEGLSIATGLSLDVKQRLLGEAYFIRGFYYFYLVNLYGEVPLILSTDYKVNANLPKTPINSVYQQIVTDLKQAQQLLDNRYLDVTLKKEALDRVRPNKMAATAMLARAYLYTEDYAQAETQATEVINQTSLYSIIGLNDVFLKNSRETIWALQPVRTNFNTDEGDFYIYPAEGPNNVNNVYLSDDLLKSFDLGDQRKAKWIGNLTVGSKTYPYSLKYKVKTDSSLPTEYTIVLRLAEQYLIRAEARILNNNIEGGIADLNILRRRATDLSALPDNRLKPLLLTLSKEKAKEELEKERRHELFTEWGNRWYDLKRTGRIDEVMTVASPTKGGIWDPNKSLYPIPQIEITRNHNLIQNPGYH